MLAFEVSKHIVSKTLHLLTILTDIYRRSAIH
jgi:hypothetical protein